MAVQTQQSSLAARLGGRLAAVNAECAGAPLDLGRQRLPGGIRDGIAVLQTMVFKTQDRDDGKVPKGEIFMSASAAVLYPVEHGGVMIKGYQTFLQIPLCDIPAKDLRKASTFRDNFNKFRSLLQALGVGPCQETQQSDPTGVKTDAYWKAAMQSLCDPQRPQGPVYISFSTRDWTPAKTPRNPNPDTMTIEEWHGPADPDKVAKLISGQVDPGAGVTTNGAINTSTVPFEEPPMGAVDPRSVSQSEQGSMDLADEVSQLVEIVTNDPEQATEEGQAAAARLEDLAWAAGWTKEQTAAADWAGMGDMALNPPEAGSDVKIVAVGTKWMFAKRAKDGSKLKNTKGDFLPSQEVEVTSVNTEANIVTVKTTRDNKDVVDIRSKKPVEVKFEWLEPLA